MDRFAKRIGSAVLGAFLGLAVALMPFAGFSSWAMDSRISFSDPETTAGEQFDVRMKITSTTGETLGSATVMLSYDPNYLEFLGGDNAEGGAGTVKVTGSTSLGQTEWVYTLKFRAVQAGDTSITISDWEIYDADSKMAANVKEGSSAIKIGAAAGASVNANLSSLKISPGVLPPDFSPDLTEYTAVVGGDVDKITVSAPTADPGAKVVISGNSSLQIGENTVTCKVTAEDASTTKTYTIVVTKQEGEVEYGGGASGSLTRVEVNGVDYELAASFDESILPEGGGFAAKEYSYKGQDILAGVQEDTGLTIIYLIASDGSGDFFVYDESSDEWSPYVLFKVPEKYITIVPMEKGVEIPEGFADTTVELNGTKVRGWVWDSEGDPKYCVVYGMNQDGDRSFYRYDLKEKTLQRYFADPAVKTGVSEEEYQNAAKMYNDLLKDYKQRGYMLIGLAVVAALLLIGLIAALLLGRKGGDGGSGDYPAKASASRSAGGNSRGEIRTARAEEAEALTPEEKYLRGDEPESEDEAKLIEHITGNEEKQIRESLAREIGASGFASTEDDDDDFEDIQL